MSTEEIQTILRQRANPAYDAVPDYVNDLNAQWQLWNVMTPDEQIRFIRFFGNIGNFMDVAPAERAECMAKAIANVECARWETDEDGILYEYK